MSSSIEGSCQVLTKGAINHCRHYSCVYYPCASLLPVR
ncbi:hypothetical protein CGRA01v4_07419 [Colletotrichum graminicola]|nr:hypothetical protein CGRA01v4_07419 [Colletotrichum graminicola]